MKNVTIILFGATGDLSKRKILPALYQLFVKNKLEKVIIVGAAFDDVTSDQMIDAAKPFVQDKDETIWSGLRAISYYKKIDFTKPADFESLRAFVQECELKHNMVPSRLFYAATAADFFCPITHNSAEVGLLQRKNTHDQVWHRIVYEKPFGHDLQSAHTINECIKNCIDESQVYRIDHYLTKEVVSNIAMIERTAGGQCSGRNIEDCAACLGQRHIGCRNGRTACYVNSLIETERTRCEGIGRYRGAAAQGTTG